MKKSRERGISFTYERNGKFLHNGIITSEEYEKWNNCKNPLAPVDSDIVSNVYAGGERRTDLDGLTSKELKNIIPNTFN